ncbi:MAG: AAA family ATPase [Calditrichia bacterium]|nr:AAA family ATPase [Calditrichia bacterium]
MYIEYFGLKDEPFNLAPDPKYLFLSEGHKEALARLQFGVEMRKGLIVLTGEVGSGKSTLAQSLVANQKPKHNSALIINPRIVGGNLISHICLEFGIELDFKEMSKADILNILYEYILKKSFYDENFTLIIDDAHDLDSDQFDEILLLSKIETNTRQLLQLVLVGLPEMLNKLKSPEMLSLFQRIQIQYYLKPFSYSETQNFLLHRLAKAGHPRQDLFKADAVQRIFQLSKGIPRTICVIASNALLYAYLNGLKKVDYQVINAASDESLQGVATREEEQEMTQIREKFPPHLKDKPPALRKKRRWLKWLMYSIFFIIAFISLNILAQYLIQYFNLF